MLDKLSNVFKGKKNPPSDFPVRYYTVLDEIIEFSQTDPKHLRCFASSDKGRLDGVVGSGLRRRRKNKHVKISCTKFQPTEFCQPRVVCPRDFGAAVNLDFYEPMNERNSVPHLLLSPTIDASLYCTSGQIMGMLLHQAVGLEESTCKRVLHVSQEDQAEKTSTRPERDTLEDAQVRISHLKIKISYFPRRGMSSVLLAREEDFSKN